MNKKKIFYIFNYIYIKNKELINIKPWYKKFKTICRYIKNPIILINNIKKVSKYRINDNYYVYIFIII